jgi:hypothetical protein
MQFDRNRSSDLPGARSVASTERRRKSALIVVSFLAASFKAAALAANEFY